MTSKPLKITYNEVAAMLGITQEQFEADAAYIESDVYG